MAVAAGMAVAAVVVADFPPGRGGRGGLDEWRARADAAAGADGSAEGQRVGAAASELERPSASVAHSFYHSPFLQATRARLEATLFFFLSLLRKVVQLVSYSRHDELGAHLPGGVRARDADKPGERTCRRPRKVVRPVTDSTAVGVSASMPRNTDPSRDRRVSTRVSAPLVWRRGAPRDARPAS